MSTERSPVTNSQAIIAGYANYFELGHNALEFLIDFGQIDPQNGEINIYSRFALGPTHAKLFANLLNDAVAQYERRFGAIADVTDDYPLNTALDSTPDFNRRAIDACRRPVASDTRRSASKTKKKR